MSKKLISNNDENDDFNLKSEEIDYENLIIRLKEIKKTISLLEKIIIK